jgi:hypothetical protein
MSNKKKQTHGARVDVGADTISNKALTDRAQLVGTMAPLTTAYQQTPVLKLAIDEYVASAVAVVAAETKVANLEAALVQARADRDADSTVCRSCHAAAVAQVEKRNPTPNELTSYGFKELEVVKLSGAVPTAILWSYDHKAGLLHLHVKYAGGARESVVEISTDPIGAATYKRLEGHGAKRAVAGYAAGTYWVRAASSLAGGISDWFGPVAVVVK